MILSMIFVSSFGNSRSRTALTVFAPCRLAIGAHMVWSHGYVEESQNQDTGQIAIG